MVEEGFYVRGEGLGSLHTQLLVALLNVSMVLGERRDGRREEGWEEKGGMLVQLYIHPFRCNSAYYSVRSLLYYGAYVLRSIIGTYCMYSSVVG